MPSPSFWQIVASYVATYGVPLVGYVVLRVLTVSVTLQSMMRRAPDVIEAAPETAADNAGSRIPEALTFSELDAAKGILLNGPYENRLERALQTGSRTWSILWQAFFAYALTATAVLIAFLFSRGSRVNGLQLPLSIFLGGLLLFALILFFVVGSRYRSIRRVPVLTPIVCLLILTAISIVGGQVMKMPFYLHLLPILWPAIVVAGGYGQIRRAARREGNLKLLILRVFGADRNTSFVFGPLMRSWQFLGSYFTVVDPSYIRYQSSLSSAETRWKLLRFFSLYVVCISALSLGATSVITFLSATNPRVATLRSLSRMQQQELIGMLAWLILIPMAVLPALLLVKRRFIRNVPMLERRVSAAERQTGGWSGVFKGFPMFCYDNVWKRAVHALLGASDVVLMDLRGFSPVRAGCEYEVGVLIDRYPLEKIIFLVDQGETKKDVHELIRRRWSAMSATSPNRDQDSPAVKTYATGDEEKRDIPRILALLASSIDSESEVLPAEPKFRLTRLPGRILESLDMAVTKPRIAAVVLPLLLLAVSALLFWRVRPIVRSFRAIATPNVVAVAPSAPVMKGTPLSAAGVRTEARAAIVGWFGWDADGESYSNPIEVTVDLTGGAAAEADLYGKVHITSATDTDGVPLKELKINFPGAESGFEIIDRSAEDFFTHQPKHPPNGLGLKVRFRQPKPEITQIGNLSGNVTVQMPDPAKMIGIDNIGAQLSIPGNVQLNHPKLATLGKVSLVVQDFDPENAQVTVENLREDLTVRVVDAAGKTHYPNLQAQIGDSTSFVFPIEDGLLAKGRLEIIWGYRSVEVPFEFKNVEILGSLPGPG